MKKFTAIEWQSFSLKKDIEFIANKFKENRVVQYSLLFQIATMILGTALAKIYDDINNVCFWIILAILGFIPFPIIFLKWLLMKCKENKHNDKMDPKNFINAFDNEIVYYILISESYCTMLTEALSNNNAHTDMAYKDMVHFYYTQASYYFQKTITDLSSINNIAKEVLSSNEDNIVAKKLISLPRYINIKNLLTTIYEYLENNKNLIK